MRVLGVDPSSSCTGVALLSGKNAFECDMWRVTGENTKAAFKAMVLTPEQRAAMGREHMPAYRRIHQTLTDLVAIVDEARPDLIVVEVPSGQAGSGSKRGAKSSLAVYGAAAGGVWAWLMAHHPNVVPVSERAWTAGAGDKGERQAAVSALYRQYDASRDQGGDVSDAIGLARWGLNEHAGMQHGGTR